METTIENNKADKKIKSDKGNAKDTLYRVTLQNQLKSLAIVDQKANIIIGINTILISIIMATIGMETSFEQFGFSDNLNISLPFSIMLISCAASGIVSILVVRPTSKLWFRNNESKLFFNNYSKINLEQFKLDMTEITKNNQRIYEELNTDIYLQGLTIQRKYRLV